MPSELLGISNARFLNGSTQGNKDILMTVPNVLSSVVSLAFRRRWAVIFSAIAVAMAGLAGGWWYFHTPLVEPPTIAELPDAEVRQALERARQHVLDQPHSAEAWGLLGMILLAHRFDPEADRCFTQACRLDPRRARWPYA